VINRHAVPNARLPIITIIAINLGFMIAGALQVETVFSWPGIGRLMYEALKARDYPLLQGIFLIVSFCVILANFAADIMYGYLDPGSGTEAGYPWKTRKNWLCTENGGNLSRPCSAAR
jgi:peptide/nickel transport system permease protein